MTKGDGEFIMLDGKNAETRVVLGPLDQNTCPDEKRLHFRWFTEGFYINKVEQHS